MIRSLADLSMGLMALLNLIAILLLSGIALKLRRDYDGQREEGLTPRFERGRLPEVAGRLAPDVW